MKKNVLLIVTAVAACIAGVAQAQSDKPPPGDPCKLLTDAEVRRVFQDAKPGQRDTRVDKHGIASCVWSHSRGRFMIQLMKGDGTIDDEIRSMASGNVDPLKWGRADEARYVTVNGIGDGARAFVEPTDAKRGIVQGVAMLIARRGDKQIILRSDQLPNGERSAALKAMEELGRDAAKRL